MADFLFVQLDRAFGGEASPLSTAVQTFILIGTHGKHTAWPIEMLRWPSELDLMARLAGFRLQDRWADWSRTPFASDSDNQVVVFERDA